MVAKTTYKPLRDPVWQISDKSCWQQDYHASLWVLPRRICHWRHRPDFIWDIWVYFSIRLKKYVGKGRLPQSCDLELGFRQRCRLYYWLKWEWSASVVLRHMQQRLKALRGPQGNKLSISHSIRWEYSPNTRLVMADIDRFWWVFLVLFAKYIIIGYLIA